MARFLVTAGPTREAIDPVRYLSNRSSGRMGYALAAALLELGHAVDLISGPVNLQPPAGAQFTSVESAAEMLAAAIACWPLCAGVFGVAAVADYRPAVVSKAKLKRAAGEHLTLELLPNPDILAILAAQKGTRFAVGFAVGSQGHMQNIGSGAPPVYLGNGVMKGFPGVGSATVIGIVSTRDVYVVGPGRGGGGEG